MTQCPTGSVQTLVFISELLRWEQSCIQEQVTLGVWP